jgi:hypothetical protein
MKTLKALIVIMIGLSVVLAAGTAFADGKYRYAGHSYTAYPHGKHVYVERHVHRYAVAPRYAWGYYPAYPRVYARPVYREYCAPYASPPVYTPAYRPGWSFGFSLGW